MAEGFIGALPTCCAPQVKMATLQLFGSAEQCEQARGLIEEAVDNREQKQAQRKKEYEKKKEVGCFDLLRAGLALVSCSQAKQNGCGQQEEQQTCLCVLKTYTPCPRPRRPCHCGSGQVARPHDLPHAPRARLRDAGPAAGRLQARHQGRLQEAGAQVASRQEPQCVWGAWDSGRRGWGWEPVAAAGWEGWGAQLKLREGGGMRWSLRSS